MDVFVYFFEMLLHVFADQVAILLVLRRSGNHFAIPGYSTSANKTIFLHQNKIFGRG